MKKALLLFIIVLFFGGISFGQGCSDAGFCSMGAMRPSQVYNKKINFKLRELEVGYYRGETHVTATINAATLDFTFGINDDMSMHLKLPYMWVNGTLGETSDLGDISVSLTRNLKSADSYHINGTLGVKIPTNNADLDDSNTDFTTNNIQADLPMYYQTSLGSFDLIAGAAYVSKDWMFSTGIQVALTENENDFRWGQWENYPSQNINLEREGAPTYVAEYDLANDLKRGTDIMLRVERAFHFSKWDIRAGLLPIFRITKDEVLDVRPSSTTRGERIKVDDTTGMALTAIGNVAYHFSTKQSAKLLYGLKITDREINPDGLTRDNVVSISYVYRF
ncbi:MAG: hypothetical protein AAGA02_05375 [Bacteroidota bacterium]